MMLLYTLLVVLYDATIAAAAPNTVKPGVTAVHYIAKFDDVNADLVSGVPARGITPLGPYQNLYYNAIGVISDQTVAAGVPAQSSPNSAGFDVVAETQGKQYITSKYLNSITNSFDLYSFYFGCLVDSQETDTSLPQSCSLNVVGSSNGKVVGNITVDYKVPLLTTKQAMQEVTLPNSFKGLDQVDLKLTNGIVADAVLATLIDNIEYVVYLQQK